MSDTVKVILTLVMSVVAIAIYLSAFVFGVSVLFWYALPMTFVMLALVVYFSIASPEEDDA